MMLCVSVYGAVALHDTQEQWVLQFGYFTDRENASDLQHTLSDSGFDVQTVAMGPPGEQRYYVVSDATSDQDDLKNLQKAIENNTDSESFIAPSPVESEAAEEFFDQPKLNYRVAQASPAPAAGNSATRSVSGSDTMLNRSPQETAESSIGFTAGGMQIIPTLGLSISYDDNVTLANTQEISSMFYVISPALRVELPSNHSVLSLIAALDMMRYQDSPIDDQDPWHLRGEWAWDISTRQNFNLYAQYGEGADKRGQGRRQGVAGLIPLELDEWDRWDYGGSWDYGAVGAHGRLALRAGGADLTYTNNRGVDGFVGTQALDRDWQFYGGTFYWRVAPKTSLLLDYLHTDIDYTLATGTSDSVEESWMLGITWDATARTSGTIQYGNLTKDFDDPSASNYDGPTWIASINWRPRTYSVFTLTGSRNTQEPDGGGDYVLRQDVTLSWVHDWVTRFGTSVDVGYSQDEYRPTVRTDDLFYWGVAGRYTFNQHFRFGGSVKSYDRSSDDGRFDYKQMIFMLSLEATY